MSSEPVHVLCVDDDSRFVELTATYLEREQNLIAHTETSASDGLDCLDEEPIDCIVSDYQMPRMSGLDFLRAVRERYPDLPFILFTAEGSEDIAEKAIKAGVSSYLQKQGAPSQFTVLGNRIENLVTQYRAEQRAAQLEQKHQLVAESASDAFWTVDPQTESVTLSEGIEQFGYSPGIDFDREWFLERIHPEDRNRVRHFDEKLFAGEEAAFDELTGNKGWFSTEYRFKRADGSYADCTERGIILFEDGEPIQMVGTMTDITERKNRERNLRHHQTLTRTASDVIIRINSESVIQDVNPAVSDVFGYESEELIGESLTTLMSPEMAEKHRKGLDQYLREGERQLDWEYVELSGVRADGTEVPLGISFSEYVYDGDRYFTGIIRDITERKAREAELQETTQRLEAVLETVPSAVFMWTLDGEVLLLNDYAREVHDLNDVDVRGRSMEEIFAPRFVEQFRETQQRVLDVGEVVEVEETLLIGGEERTYLTLTGPVYGEEGEIRATCGIAMDITEQKMHQRELERKTERLGRFASILSHDLRNPVSVAQGYLNLAQEEYDSSNLDKVDTALHRIDSLIDDVLALAREGGIVTEPVELSVPGVAREAWETIESSSATLEIVDPPESLRGDRGRVRRLFENLFRNAIEHGGEDVVVRVGSLSENEGFYVEDNGRGIPEADVEKLFEWGYSKGSDGTGFGLVIVEQIVEAHGWTISATNGTNGGARFEIKCRESVQ